MSQQIIASPTGVCRIVVTLGLLCGAGCANPFGHPEDDLIGPSLQRLHEIETVDLETSPAMNRSRSSKPPTRQSRS